MKIFVFFRNPDVPGFCPAIGDVVNTVNDAIRALTRANDFRDTVGANSDRSQARGLRRRFMIRYEAGESEST